MAETEGKKVLITKNYFILYNVTTAIGSHISNSIIGLQLEEDAGIDGLGIIRRIESQVLDGLKESSVDGAIFKVTLMDWKQL